jgi:hypothetical protein
LEPQNQNSDIKEGTLTARTLFADGRVSAILDVPDGPPTWVKIFSSLDSAERFALVYKLEFVDNVSPHD